MVNQRQILATLQGEESPYEEEKYTDLFMIVSQFEELYATYNEFNQRMDRYWSMRLIMQDGLKEIEAIVVKGDLLRIDKLPFMQRMPGMPEDLPRGRKVLLQIHNCDLVDLVMDASLIKVLDESVETDDEDEPIEEVATPEGEGAETPAEGGEAASEEGAPETTENV